MVSTTWPFRYASPTYPGLYSQLAGLMIVFGLLLTGWFFVVEVAQAKNYQRKTIVKEVALGIFASLFLGVGCFFLLLAAGIYV